VQKHISGKPTYQAADYENAPGPWNSVVRLELRHLLSLAS
jgi:hypothetical protein